MGLFSSKKIVSVSSKAINLIERPPNAVAQSVVASIMKGESIPDGLLDDLSNGVSQAVNKAYRYGLDEYTLGLPQGSVSSSVQATVGTVEAIIENEIQQQILVIYSFIGPLTPAMAAMGYLRNNRGYKFSTNEITVHPYLDKNPTQTLKLYSAQYLPATAEILLTYKTPTTNDVRLMSFAVTKTETIPVPTGLYLEEEYCVAAYSILDEQGNLIPQEEYWYYRISDATYPDLQAPDLGFGSTSYLPVVPLRRNNKSLTQESVRDTELFKTSEELLDILYINIVDIGQTLSDSPSIDDIDHAYIMFGVEINSTNQASLRYLVQYFDYLYDVSIYKQNDFRKSIQNNRTPFFNKSTIFNPGSSQTIEEYGLKVSINYQYITSELIEGNVGPIGFVQCTTGKYYVDTTSIWGFIDNNYIRYRLQVTDTVYKEVTVYGPRHINTIYNGHAVTTTLSDARSENNHDFLIPIHYGIAKQLPLMVRNNLYYDSYRMVLNSYDITKVKWYEKGIFKVVLIVVAVVISIATSGTQSWLTGLAAAASNGVIAVISYILPALLTSIAVPVAMKFVAKAVGGELGLILGAVMTVVSIAYGVKGGGTLFGVKLPNAASMLQASNALASESVKLIQEETFDVLREIDAFEAQAEKQWTVLEEAQKLLDTNLNVNPINMVCALNPYKGFADESPSAFYERTIHTGNIGVRSLDVVSNYVDLMLKLPRS